MQTAKSPDIVRELKKGNVEALDALFDLHYPSLCSFAGGMLADPPAAEDIVSEVFTVFWKKHTDFESLNNVKAFLYISTKNACLNHLKKSRRDHAMRNGLIRMQDGDHEEFVLNQMIRSEVLQKIYASIETLPVQSRNVFKLCYLEGNSNMEVAEKLNISIHTVKNHKTRALHQLRLKCSVSLS